MRAFVDVPSGLNARVAAGRSPRRWLWSAFIVMAALFLSVAFVWNALNRMEREIELLRHETASLKAEQRAWRDWAAEANRDLFAWVSTTRDKLATQGFETEPLAPPPPVTLKLPKGAQPP